MSSERVLNYRGGVPTSTTSRTTFQSSELSRGSAEVFAAASDHPIEVTRRDGETLVLMTERADRDRNALLELAAQLIAAATDTNGTLADRLSERFPWMLALNPDEREDCAHELLDAALASFATGQPHLAIAELTAWRETATAIAAGLGSTPVEWFDEGVPVERPRTDG